MQIHIPSLVIFPPTPTTRFSSYFLSNYKLGLFSLMATRKFLADTLGRREDQKVDFPPQQLPIRTSIRIPANTKFSFDENLLERFLATQELDHRDDEHIILSVVPPGSDVAENFHFLELRWLLDRLSREEREANFVSKERLLQFLLVRLIHQRHPYVTGPAWLDSGEASEVER